MTSISLVRFLLLPFAALMAWPADADDDFQTARRMYLIDGHVVDTETGEPIESFRVLPGTPYRAAEGDAPIAAWQPRMIQEMKEGVLRWPRTRGYKQMRFRVEADGYRPATTNWLGVGGPYMRLKVHLRRDPGIEAIVITPDGTPAKDATVAIGQPNRGVRLDGCRIAGIDKPPSSRLSDQWRQPQTVRTSADGHCVVPPESDPIAVLCVVHPDGFLEMPLEAFINAARQSPVELQLRPWGRVRGKVIWKDKPGAGALVSATVHRHKGYPGMIEAYPNVTSAADGDFALDYLPPGTVQLGHRVKLPEGTKLSPTGAVYEYPIFHIDVRAGQTLNVDIGGTGIEVIGKLAGVDSFDDVTIAIQPPAPDVFNWARFGNMGGGNDLQKGFAALRASSFAPLYFRGSLPVAKDGTFRIENVMTGKFNLVVSGSAAGATSFDATSFGDNPIDLGTIQVKPAEPRDDG